MNAVDIARWQFAIVTVYHFFFVPVTIGLSVIVAGFVYAAAMRDQMLPRKPIEKPLPKEPEKKED